MSDEFDPTDKPANDAARVQDADMQKAARLEEQEDLKFVMSHQQGRRLMWRLLSKAGVYRTSFSQNGLEMAFREGQRNLGLFLQAEILDACPERHQQMVKESRDARPGRPGKR